ncbi:GNAT family N-acetyltransferase [Lacticaseibacillus kribbianus]|uniref:GNAT family N-acetyltransferase n=1 Tax=Lacticaseibacillus kribbianus TaxID=2926292 RepID=UPI001CD25AE1|nr:GNAT family N-acetyltransferase [Lacticaseibacillus kribbianus]
MNTTLRRCTLADIDQLATMMAAPALAPAPSAAALRRALATPNVDFYFLFAGCTPVGFLRCNAGDAQSTGLWPDQLEVAQLYVAPAWRGHGCGRVLLHQAEQVAQAGGQTRLWHRGPADAAFLRATGFWPDATQTMWQKDLQRPGRRIGGLCLAPAAAAFA